MPICANDAADIASSKSANSSERMEQTIRIVITFCSIILRFPGVAPRLRVGRIERHDFRATHTTEDYVSLANSSDRNSLISEMSRSEQKRSLPVSLSMGRPTATPLPAILETFAK